LKRITLVFTQRLVSSHPSELISAHVLPRQVKDTLVEGGVNIRIKLCLFLKVRFVKIFFAAIKQRSPD